MVSLSTETTTMKIINLDCITLANESALAACSSRDLPEWVNSRSVKVGAMLVSPVNGDTYVVDFNKQVAAVFIAEKGSGTDKRRQFIKATIYFESLPEQADLLRAAA
jgi:hypothetical protein